MRVIVNGKTNISGSTIINNHANIEYLVLAGGGGGTLNASSHGGAGAGGLLINKISLPKSTYTITVGAGGAGRVYGGTPLAGNSGNTSSISGTTVFVQAQGGAPGDLSLSGAGIREYFYGSMCGWGVWSAGFNGFGVPIADQGHRGGRACSSFAGGGGCSTRIAGGGGGAGGPGISGGTILNRGGDGGIGKLSSINGTPTYYGGGGGGNTYTGVAGGTGGLGGGGNGSNTSSSVGTSGAANTGGGAGGSAGTGNTPSGGSGIVIIRYPGSTQIMTGGTVSFITGYVVHTFTGSGTLTYT